MLAVDVEVLIQKSFYTFQQQRALPDLRSKQQALLAQLSSADLALEQSDLVSELHAAMHSAASDRPPFLIGPPLTRGR